MGKYREIPGYPGPYFSTWSVVHWQPVFSKRDAFGVIIDSFRYCRENKGLRLHAFVIMPTHVHLIASAPDGGRFSDLARDMRSFTSHQIVSLCEGGERKHFLHVFRSHAEYGQKHKVWQERYQPKLLVGDKMVLQKLRYVHENPVRAGYVDAPEAWLHSSARNYVGSDDCVIEVDRLF